MDTLVGIVLTFLGLVAVTASWNAIRPVIDPTRRYSPWWLPAMVVGELAPFWLVVTIVTMVSGVIAGGADSWGGLIGLTLLALAAAFLLWAIARSIVATGAIRRRWVTTEIPAARGRARWFGRPVRMPTGVVEQHHVPWLDGQTLDLVRPDGDGGAGGVAIYVHGGGWTRGDPQRQARDLYGALAVAGWTVLAIRYPFPPAVTLEQQIDAVRRSAGWAREVFAQGGRPVVIIGGSAGGHLAAMAALTPTAPDERVDACVGMYAIYDMANRNRTRAPWRLIRVDVMGESVADAPERYRLVSPLDRIHPASPPFLVVHGTHDTLVPIGEAHQFVAALSDAERPVDLIEVAGAQHAFDGVSSPTSRTVAAAIVSWLDRVVPHER